MGIKHIMHLALERQNMTKETKKASYNCEMCECFYFLCLRGSDMRIERRQFYPPAVIFKLNHKVFGKICGLLCLCERVRGRHYQKASVFRRWSYWEIFGIKSKPTLLKPCHYLRVTTTLMHQRQADQTHP